MYCPFIYMENIAPYMNALASYLTGALCVNNYHNGRNPLGTYYLHKRASCRLCTQHVRLTYACSKCQQCFCIIHLLRHISIFQKIRSRINQVFTYTTLDCNSRDIDISDDFIKYASPKMARALASNLSSNSVELKLYSNANPKTVSQYAIEIARPKNITAISKLL
jgi:hypothetical protein